MLMRRLALPLSLLLAPVALAASAASHGAARGPVPPDIPFTSFVLDNGLTVIVHEDHALPIVAVDIWYHVGSGCEKPGRTGFAHLFEHLMFNGSEHFNDDFFKPFERLGATGQNGTTNTDRTNYFETVPTTALDTTLWMESDRMGHLLGALDQARLDEQRGVVQNEKRQNENQPYGTVFLALAANTYPAGHPYSWTTIGSMEDLNAASLDDVKGWFKAWYGPSNAVLALAGDVTPAHARELAEKYFGDITPGPPVVRQSEWIAKMAGSHRMRLEDRVPQSRLYVLWNTPAWGAPDATRLDLAADVLGTGKSSRLWQRLVVRDRTATTVTANAGASELGGQVVLTVTVAPGKDPAAVEAAVDAELKAFLSAGPSQDELDRVKAADRAQFVRRTERLGGFGGRAEVLVSSQVFGGRPDAWKDAWSCQQTSTTAQIRDAAQAWLSDGRFTLLVTPFPQRTASATGADRSALPAAPPPPVARFPDLRRAELPNGLKVVVCEEHRSPQVVFTMLVDAGTSADAADTRGLASLTLDALSEGTTSRDSARLADDLERQGATLVAESSLDLSTLTVSAVSEHLDASLDLLADVALHPAFAPDVFARLKTQRLAQVAREKTQPATIVQRLLPRFVLGEGHAYAGPASGTEATVGRLTRDDLARFHQTWFAPNATTLVVTGDTTLEAVMPKLTRAFGSWQRRDVPAKHLDSAVAPDKPVLYLVDRPGSVQSVIAAAESAPPKSSPDDVPLIAAVGVLGGTFTSRINMNLREDKHWSYGARAVMDPARGPRVLAVNAPVQTDKTKEAVSETLKELQGISGAKPVTADELSKIQAAQTLTLGGRWETVAALAAAIADLTRYGLPDRYWDGFAPAMRALDLDRVNHVAQDVVHPDRITWVVVGDRSKIEAGLRSLGIAEVRVVDADGKPLP